MKLQTGISRRRFLAAAAGLPALAQPGRKVHIVPNFHPASCGWLTNFSKERVYCANSYFDHLDRVRDDPDYSFVLSEVNNMIAMMNFRPERTEELKRAHPRGPGRAGEWLFPGVHDQSLGRRSAGAAGRGRLAVAAGDVRRAAARFAWTIDVCGTHDQMAQICAGLGLEAMVYTRKNPTGSALHWAESPDGTKILACSPGTTRIREVIAAKEPLNDGVSYRLSKRTWTGSRRSRRRARPCWCWPARRLRAAPCAEAVPEGVPP